MKRMLWTLCCAWVIRCCVNVRSCKRTNRRIDTNLFYRSDNSAHNHFVTKDPMLTYILLWRIRYETLLFDLHPTTTKSPAATTTQLHFYCVRFTLVINVNLLSKTAIDFSPLEHYGSRIDVWIHPSAEYQHTDHSMHCTPSHAFLKFFHSECPSLQIVGDYLSMWQFPW